MEAKEYTVVWAIEVTADTELDAAHQARDIMQHSNDPEYIANTFAVLPFTGTPISGLEVATWVDLDKIEDRV